MDDEKLVKKKRKCEIQVGDLVKLRDYDWLSRDLALVTEVRELVHDQSNQTYHAVTATINGKEYTFSHRDFELVSKAERKSK